MAGLSGYCPESPEEKRDREKRERLYDPRKAASREKSPQPVRRSSGS